jgi:hypothetical protein
MSRYNNRFWNNQPKRFSRYWWHNLFYDPMDTRDASGACIWDNLKSATGEPLSRYWAWWNAQP